MKFSLENYCLNKPKASSPVRLQSLQVFLDQRQDTGFRPSGDGTLFSSLSPLTEGSNPLHPHFCLQPCTQGMCRCLKELFLLRFNRLRLSGCLKSFHLNLFKWRITGLSHHRFLIQILERALYQSILFSQNVSQNLFDQNQSGFKSVCSTETVLLCVVLCVMVNLPNTELLLISAIPDLQHNINIQCSVSSIFYGKKSQSRAVACGLYVV